MATKIAVSPLIGANLDNTNISTSAQRAAGVAATGRLLDQVFGSDGKLYVYGEANAVIAANTAVCTIAAATGLATATGGGYLSPVVALAVGDRCWFSKASV